MGINWYPGHMFKTKRELKDAIKMVDVSVEILDARIPISSRNPDLQEIVNSRPSIKKIIVLNKVDLADEAETKKWKKHFEEKEKADVVLLNAKESKGIKELKEKIVSYKKNITTVKTMISGIPNVGKSTTINRILGKNSLEAKNKPGVTKSLKWTRVDKDISMLDTPGMLWPSFEERTGINLGITGSIKDEVLDLVEIAYEFLKMVLKEEKYLKMLMERYDIIDQQLSQIKESSNPAYILMLTIGENKKILKKGAEVDTEKTAQMILQGVRMAKIGRISLEKPEMLEENNGK